MRCHSLLLSSVSCAPHGCLRPLRVLSLFNLVGSEACKAPLKGQGKKETLLKASRFCHKGSFILWPPRAHCAAAEYSLSLALSLFLFLFFFFFPAPQTRCPRFTPPTPTRRRENFGLSTAALSPGPQRLYRSVAERQFCKLKVLGPIPSGGS